MQRSLHPCRNGPRCTCAKYFHGTELRKSSKRCNYDAGCRWKETCPFLHAGEEHLIGKVFWRYSAAPFLLAPHPQKKSAAVAPLPLGAAANRWAALAARAGEPVVSPLPSLAPAAAAGGGAAAVPRYTAPLDDYAILSNLLSFFGQKEYGRLRQVNKSLKECLEQHVQLEEFTWNLSDNARCPSLKFVKKLTLTQNWEKLSYEHRRIAGLAAADLAPLDEATNVCQIITCGTLFSDFCPKMYNMPHLKKLTLAGVVNTNTLVQALPHLPQLEKLKIYSITTAGEMNIIIRAAAALPKLRSFEFTHSCAACDFTPFTQTRSLKNLAVYATHTNILQLLNLPLEKLKVSTLTGSSALPSLFELPQQFTLKNLQIHNYTYPILEGDASQKFFHDVVTRCPQLSFLRVPPSLYSLSTLLHLPIWAWTGCPQIKGIEFSSGTIDPALRSSFFNSLPTGLEQLFIHGIELSTAIPLMENLPRFKLWSLGLNGNPIENPLPLARALAEHAPELENLGFTLPRISDDTAARCMKVLSQIPTLHHVYMYNNGYKATQIADAAYAPSIAAFSAKNTLLVRKIELSTYQKKKKAF